MRIKEQAVYLGELEPQLADLEQRMSALREEQREVQGDVNQQKMTLEAGELHLEQLNKHMAEAKEREATLLEDRSVYMLWVRGCPSLVYDTINSSKVSRPSLWSMSFLLCSVPRWIFTPVIVAVSIVVTLRLSRARPGRRTRN